MNCHLQALAALYALEFVVGYGGTLEGAKCRLKSLSVYYGVLICSPAYFEVCVEK